MDFTNLLSFLCLIVFLILVVLMIIALLAPKKEKYGDGQYLPPPSKHANSNWRNRVFKMLVMRPWPYKDIYSPLNRLYWPDEQPHNRANRRRQSRRKR